MKRLARTGDPASFTGVLLPPVEAHIRKLETEWQECIRTEGADSSPAAREKLGPLVPLARPPRGDGADGDVVSRRYVEKLLRIDVEQYADAASFVLRNRYCIWTIRPATYRKALQREVAGVLELSTIPETPRTVSELVAMLRDILQEIGDDLWEQHSIKEAAAPFLSSVRARVERQVGGGVTFGTEAWGYALARWVVAASEPGPGIYCAMELLGKAETIRRMDVAHEIATAEALGGAAE